MDMRFVCGDGADCNGGEYYDGVGNDEGCAVCGSGSQSLMLDNYLPVLNSLIYLTVLRTSPIISVLHWTIF